MLKLDSKTKRYISFTTYILEDRSNFPKYVFLLTRAMIENLRLEKSPGTAWAQVCAATDGQKEDGFQVIASAFSGVRKAAAWYFHYIITPLTVAEE